MGFGIGAQHITVDGYYGHNEDECISIVNKRRISSLRMATVGCPLVLRGGANSQVSDIVFDNWVMGNAVYGAGYAIYLTIPLCPAGLVSRQCQRGLTEKDLASNITWKNMKLVSVPIPIFMTQKCVIFPPWLAVTV